MCRHLVIPLTAELLERLGRAHELQVIAQQLLTVLGPLFSSRYQEALGKAVFEIRRRLPVEQTATQPKPSGSEGGLELQGA